MSRQQALFADAVSSGDEKQRALLRKLGMSELPTYQMQCSMPKDIVVPGAELIARPHKLAKSIAHVGVLHPPVVVCCATGEKVVYEVVLGRRRILAVQMLDLPLVECKVYAHSSPGLRSLLALMENEQRSAAWIKEVEDLGLLVNERVGMTLDDLVDMGFDRTSLKERLKMAQLPEPILYQILAGEVSYALAKKITRLTERQQNRLISLIQDGEQITADLLKGLWREQIGPTLLQVQMEVLPEVPSHEQRSLETSMETSEETVFSGSPPKLSQVLAVLQAYEQHPEHADQSTRTLLKALIQRLSVLQRECP